jgi:tyrosyl-tRNA synthetase
MFLAFANKSKWDSMDVETKIDAMKSFAQEIVTEAELRHIFETNHHPVAYDGFEPSGLAPLHFGPLRAKNANKMLDIGIHLKLYLADYFALINNKLEGNLERIRETGRYFIEVWKASGIDMDKVEIIWAKDLMDDFTYWDRFIKIGKAVSLDRTKRAITIMGRSEGDSLDTAQLFYPPMQVTDIFQMDIDICQLGIDQRRANILAREVAQKYKWKVPAIVSHPYILGLQGVPKEAQKSSDEGVLMQYKMSKSNPKSSILVHNTAEEIKEKINSAYCPERIIEGNPLFNYIEMIILESRDLPITIERPQKFGGAIEAKDYAELVKFYSEGKIHPIDLKAYVADELEKIIRPIREHFEKNRHAQELYQKVRNYKITK